MFKVNKGPVRLCLVIFSLKFSKMYVYKIWSNADINYKSCKFDLHQ